MKQPNDLARRRIKQVHFVGIGGSGMGGIAEVLTDKVEAHQRYILTTYCETPAVLGGDAV